MALLAGRDYPNSYAELRAWFNEDWKCLNYLDWLRWPDGFVPLVPLADARRLFRSQLWRRQGAGGGRTSLGRE